MITNTKKRIKAALKENGVYQYELAERIGVSEFTFVRWLRKELTEKEEKRFFKMIEEIGREKAERESNE